MEMRFTWDPAKARSNRRKHGVSFEQATQVFDDPNHILLGNYLFPEEGEPRQQVIGLSQDVVLLSVIFVDRSTDNLTRIRLISARKANANEEYLYQTATSR
jgi:uncharacterized DUF497 family protein